MTAFLEELLIPTRAGLTDKSIADRHEVMEGLYPSRCVHCLIGGLMVGRLLKALLFKYVFFQAHVERLSQ